GRGATRLVLILDQFDEFLVEQSGQARAQAMREFLVSLHRDPLPGLTVLLALRDDYKALLLQFLDRTNTRLPGVESDRTWMLVGPFTRSHAREFLERSQRRLSAEDEEDQRLKGDLIEEMEAVEQTPGLVRPVVLNMVGVVLDRLATGDRQRLARRR